MNEPTTPKGYTIKIYNEPGVLSIYLVNPKDEQYYEGQAVLEGMQADGGPKAAGQLPQINQYQRQRKCVNRRDPERRLPAAQLQMG